MARRSISELSTVALDPELQSLDVGAEGVVC